jgi:hypothetical protein
MKFQGKALPMAPIWFIRTRRLVIRALTGGILLCYCLDYNLGGNLRSRTVIPEPGRHARHGYECGSLVFASLYPEVYQ